MKIKQDSGITLVVLIITVIILSIIAGISMNIGTGLIKRTKLENLKTNMLLIQARAKEYVEEASFKSGTDNTINDEVKSELIGTEITDTSILNSKILEQCSIDSGLYYKLEKEHLKEMGLEKIEITDKNYYIVVYDIKNIKVDVINTRGYVSEDGNIYYTLSQLNKINK